MNTMNDIASEIVQYVARHGVLRQIKLEPAGETSVKVALEKGEVEYVLASATDLDSTTYVDFSPDWSDDGMIMERANATLDKATTIRVTGTTIERPQKKNSYSAGVSYLPATKFGAVMTVEDMDISDIITALCKGFVFNLR